MLWTCLMPRLKSETLCSSAKKEKEGKGEIPFDLRIGIHTGPVVAGIVGIKNMHTTFGATL